MKNITPKVVHNELMRMIADLMSEYECAAQHNNVMQQNKVVAQLIAIQTLAGRLEDRSAELAVISFININLHGAAA